MSIFVFRKTILSHFMFSSRCMLFPTFLENKMFQGGGGRENCGVFNLLAGDLGRPSCLVLKMHLRAYF